MESVRQQHWNVRNPVLISILAHLLLLLTLLGGGILRDLRAKKSEPIWVEVRPPKNRNHIVQTTPGEKTDQAKPDAFLGERNQEVDRETVSRDRMVQMGGRKALKEKDLGKKAVSAPKLSQLGLPVAKTKKEAGAPDEPQWVDAGDRVKDHVSGFKESDRTALNTREYVFFSYYQRIRVQLDRAWVPLLRQKLMAFQRKGRFLASDTEHQTRVVVVLNTQGEVVQVRVLLESGTQDLDDAAIKAFNAAGPFPNPPKGLMTDRGLVEIPWDFILRT